MPDVGATRSPATDIVLVGLPGGERTVDIGRSPPRTSCPSGRSTATRSALAPDRDVAAVVVDPAFDPSVEPAALFEALRAATPAPIVVLGLVPGDVSTVPAPGISGLLRADAPAAEVVGTVVTAIAHRFQGDEVVAFDHLVVDLHNFGAWHGSHRLDLTLTELRVLGALVSAHGDLVTKHELQRAAWGSASAHGDSRLQAHIRRLRAKLANAPGGSGAGHCQVRTVRGLGFRLDHAGEAPERHAPLTTRPATPATDEASLPPRAAPNANRQPRRLPRRPARGEEGVGAGGDDHVEEAEERVDGPGGRAGWSRAAGRPPCRSRPPVARPRRCRGRGAAAHRGCGRRASRRGRRARPGRPGRGGTAARRGRERRRPRRPAPRPPGSAPARARGRRGAPQQVCDHPLHRRHDAAVDHDRALRPLAPPERQVEPTRQVEVDLHGRQRLLAALRVGDLEVDLRPVERRLV